MRIRHYGLLANPTRQRDLARCRECIATDPLDDDLRQTRSATTSLDPTARGGMRCPRCRIGHLVVLDVLPPRRARPP